MLHPPRHYVYLDAVARAGSIRKAADLLHVASTALNRKILEIESEVGTPLFERLPRGVRLTAAGEVLLATVRRGLSDLESAASQIEQLQGLVRGTVRIACAESVANDLVPATVAAYQRTHPGVQFRITVGGTAALIRDVLNDDVELVVAHDPPEAEGLQVIVSVPQPLCVMMRPDHPLAGNDSIRLADCERYPIALGAESFGSRRLIDRLALKLRLSLRVTLEANSVETLKFFALTTDALCFQFRVGTARDVARGELVAVPLADRDLAGGKLVMAARAGRSLPAATSSFAQVLKSALEGM